MDTTAGDRSHAATAGYRSNAATTGDVSNAATAGDGSHATTAGDGSHAATAGDGSHAATAGYRSNAAATGAGGAAVSLGGGFAACGADGFVAVGYTDGHGRRRLAVGYAGEGGIEAGVAYKADADGRLVEIGRVILGDDGRGYTVYYASGHYVAGCRRFTLDAARAHWSSPHHPAPGSAAKILAAIEAHAAGA